MVFNNKKITSLAVVLIFFLALFFATFRLSESPRTWMDEGILIQAARNLAEQGSLNIQTAPGEFVSAGFVSTGFPALYPIALSFKLFGVSLMSARMVMAIFIILLIFVAFLLLRNYILPSHYLLSLLLLVTFAPLYGHGRNVLGEIPGLFFLAVTTYLIYQLESAETRSVWRLLLIGLMAGLTMATKPIFVLLVPALFWAAFLLWRRNKVTIRDIGLVVAASVLPLVLWLWTQFTGDSLSAIMVHYLNPHSTEVLSSVRHNLKMFFTEAQPAYMALSYAIWASAIIWRLLRKEHIKVGEWLVFIFSSLVLVAFLRTAGFYRYFFLAQFWAVVYFLPSLEIYSRRLSWRIVLEIFMLSLVLFQFYQLMYKSWVANYWESTQTIELKSALPALVSGKTVFVYQAPEVVTFLPDNNYYQFLVVEPRIIIGTSSLNLAKQKRPEIIITGLADKTFSDYRLVSHLNRFFIWIRRK